MSSFGSAIVLPHFFAFGDLQWFIHGNKQYDFGFWVILFDENLVVWFFDCFLGVNLMLQMTHK